MAKWTAILLLVVLPMQGAWAQAAAPSPPPAASAPLPSGHAAGVSHANQVSGGVGILVVGAAGIIAGIVLVTTGSGGGGAAVKPQNQSITTATF